MAVDEEIVRFERGAHGAVVAAMRELERRGDGRGWINVAPALTDEQEAFIPRRSGLAAWFSGRGEPVAMATWTPRAVTPRPRPAQVGVAHGTGPHALRRLSDDGRPLPDGWQRRQDHAKHGIVADLPADARPEAVLEWLVAAVTLLTEVVDVGAHWTATVHRPDRGLNP